MTDYTSVAPPSNLSGGFDPNSAFADALQRARQIAAKINTPAAETNPSIGGTKRPLEEPDHRDAKKLAAVNDPFGAQLAAMQQQQSIPARPFEKIGMGAAANAILTEEFRVPDKMVGLIIGRGGEQITRLQSESGCKIQMAADSGGLPDRPCSLTGNKQSIERAKELMLQIVNRGGTSSATLDPGPLPDGHTMIEMMIPGGKVGLVIGKGGETIKSLQERAGVKMVMIQDGPQQSMVEKSLRISGDTPQACEYARQLVMDLITEKELESMNRGGGFHRNQMGTNDYGSAQTTSQEVTVPRQAVGVVIGKGGDMIKKIQQDSGARVQFQQDDGPGDRICMLTGAPEQIQKAQGIIHELINSILARDQQNMGRGRGRGRGGFDDRRGRGDFGPGGPGGPGPGMGRGGPPGQNRGGGPNDNQEISYTVPAGKCGIVIGKGGETIRTINQQSGAHVELSRQPPPNPNEKVFIIRGSQQQIEHAKQLINEKIGGGPPGPGYPGGPGGPGGPPNNYQQGNDDEVLNRPFSSPEPHSQQPPPPPQAYAPQGWGNAYQHWQNQPATPSDPTKDAAWAAYYAQCQQPGVQDGQQPTTPQPQGATNGHSTQEGGETSGQGSQAQAGQAQPSAGGSQPDYSAAWAEYYRSLGMFREAEMIEQQARVNQAQGQQPQAPGVTQPQTPAQQQQQQQQQQYGQQGQQYGQSPQPNQSQPQPQQQFPQYGQYSAAPGGGPSAAGQYSAQQHPAYNYSYGTYAQQQYPAGTQ